MANPLVALRQMFINALPENATRSAQDDPGLTIKTSPLLWPYEIFVLEWERRALLRDLDLMVKRDTRLDRANYVFANAATRGGITVSVDNARNSKLQKAAQAVIDQVMKDCKINAHISPWARTATRDGDLFLNIIPEMNPDGLTARIVRIKALPAISMERQDDMTDSFPDIKRAFLQIDPITRQEIQPFPLWAINHIRWKYEPGERYGRSQYYSGRTAWKKLAMMEEDLVVRRRTRAVQRRVHIIGNKDVPASEPEVNKYKSMNALEDPKNAKITTDYFVGGLGDVKNLEGDAHLDHINDVNYLLENLMIGTSVPLHILGFGRNVNRDIVDDQRKAYKEDVEGLQDLLEHGDPGTFSGLRAIFNMALALAGINPEDVTLSVRWAQLDVMSFGEMVSAVNQLRASQPTPMISRKTGLRMLARSMELTTDSAIDSELEAIDKEIQADKDAEAALAVAVNPEKPNTTGINKGNQMASGKALTDSVHQANPLHSKRMGELENSIADDVRTSFANIAQRLTSEAKFVRGVAQLTGVSAGDAEKLLDRQRRQAEVQLDATIAEIGHVDPDILRAYVLQKFNDAWEQEEASLVNRLFSRYQDSVSVAADTVHPEVRASVAFNLVSQQVLQELEQQAGTRIRGIQETTRKDIVKALQDAYESQNEFGTGASLQTYLDGISQAIQAPDWRIQTIARTEMAFAFNNANLRYQVAAGYTKFQWLAVMDNRTCQRCRDRNESIVDISSANPPPLHPNCRCILIPYS